MCMRGGFGTPMGGIPIPPYVHDQFPAEVQKAWETFDAWWQEQDRPASRKTMPNEVAAAYETIKKAQIPGYNNATGADSCYVIGVESQLID